MYFFNWLRGKKYAQPQQRRQPAVQEMPISPNLSDNISRLNSVFDKAPDLIMRKLTNPETGVQSALVYLEGLSDKNAVDNNIIKSTMNANAADPAAPLKPFATIGDVQSSSDWRTIELAILRGKSVMFIQGHAEALVYDTQGWPQRAIEDPQLESSLKGAHQGFLETDTQNIAMIRRYIPDTNLKIISYSIGRRGHTKVSVLYMEDICHPEVLQELVDRISQIDVDAIINTGELAEFIEDNPYSPFPQFILTERPDAAASQLLQGRICVIVDRSPAVMIAPATFISFFQSVDDYSTRWLIASFFRMLRFVGFMAAVMLPAFYIALISYNFEIIPLKLLLSIGESRERVPFPPFVEAFMMEITLEMIREAGIRLPAPIGQTVGLVGGIVIGQAVVQAGFVSNIMVIVVATTAIASFIIPSYDMSSGIRLLRFPMMIIASLFGIVGIVIGFMTLIAHLVTLESLGTPYGSPLAPVRFADWKDTFIRLPIWKMVKRPKSTRAIKPDRMNNNRKEGE